MSPRYAMPTMPTMPLTRPGETGWYDGKQKPVQIGVYKRLSLAYTIKYSFFDGQRWLWNQATPEFAGRMQSHMPSMTQDAPWCGLLCPPDAGYGPMTTAQGLAA